MTCNIKILARVNGEVYKMEMVPSTDKRQGSGVQDAKFSVDVSGMEGIKCVIEQQPR